MQLIQFKIRGLGDIPETGWIPIKPRLTIIRMNGKKATRHLMKAIQTINPPYHCKEKHPFRNFPTEITLSTGQRKRIQPFKRTVVFAVFNSPPSLVTELGAMTDSLYETDRIEVGRRLDYSRWINFVELASSSRWSEVSANIEKLTNSAPLSGAGQEKVLRLMQEMKSSDRIKGQAAQILVDWLTDIRNNHSDADLIDSVIGKVGRASLYNDARRIIEQRMPLFLSSDMDNFKKFITEGHRHQAGEPNRFSAVTLMDLTDNSDPDIDQLLDLMDDTIDSTKQCLCFIGKDCRLHSRFYQRTVWVNEIIAASAPAPRSTR